MSALFPDLQPSADKAALAQELEAFETPPAVLFDLIAGCPELAASLPRRVWEPCAGTGILAGALEQLGFEVVASDVHDWGYRYDRVVDVFEVVEPPAFAVVTNPPFSRAAALVRHLLSIGVRTVVLFQSWNWWAQQSEAGRLHRERPADRVLLLERRVALWPFTTPLEERRKSHSPLHFAWYVWTASATADTKVRRLPKCGASIPTARGGAA